MSKKPSLTGQPVSAVAPLGAGAASANILAASGNQGQIEPPSKRIKYDAPQPPNKPATGQEMSQMNSGGSRMIPPKAGSTQQQAKGGNGKAQSKTLTKKKLQEFDEANQREEPSSTNQRTQKFLSKARERKHSGTEITLSEDGEEAVRELLSVIKRAH